MNDFIQNIDAWDKKLMLFLNGLHNSFLDPIMLFATQRFTWLPFYIFLIAALVWKYKKKVWIYIISLALVILIADQFASGLCKPFFKRLRPCHQKELVDNGLYVLDQYAGQFGFISSHAANSFGAAVFLGLAFGNRRVLYALLAWAGLVTYSRIYVGVHFPLDLLFGALVGILAGLGVFQLMNKIIKVIDL